jgi:hypothetical protein
MQVSTNDISLEKTNLWLEHRHQFDFITKGPSGLVHGFPSAYDDKKEDAFCADDSVITDTIDKKNESGVDERNMVIHKYEIIFPQ